MMDDKEKMVPRIRFRGFGDAWEQRKLSDISTKIGSGSTPKGGSKIYSTQGVIFLRSQNIYNNTVNLNNIVYIPNKIDEQMKNTHVRYEDILLNITGASIGRSAVVSQHIEANINQHVSIIRSKEGYSPYLIQALLSSSIGQNQIRRNQAGGGREGLNFKQIGHLAFFLPSYDEQVKNSHIFSTIDNLIVASEKKGQQLKGLKKLLMEKIFSQAWRFKGFSDPWEQRKSGDIFKATSKKGHADLPVLSVTQDGGIIPRDQIEMDIKYDKNTLKNYKEVFPSDFVISLRSFQGGFEESFITGIVSPAYTVFNILSTSTQYDGYWKTVFKSHFFIESLKKVTFGIRDGKAISFKSFSSLSLRYPSDIEEQKKIGCVFDKLDDLIVANEKKLDQLKQLKKYLMQNMFV